MFSLGVCSVVGAVIMIIIYLLTRAGKMFGSFLERKEGPKDRVLWYVVIFGVVGVILGGFAQPHWDQLYACYQSTGSWQKCIIPFSK
ncbi:hypothetical protein [Pantoea dispersa]|uniref:hypothetical protein n=1 Tax=Pantoea dispersa TaxID=59814 RepID=UPI00285DF34E|nr:hypothetical protein [Pantoea dispersa]MDR6297759.1 putative membrane protein YeaQ/YmgE (transglycosylase-associated protein family) [Pantoea dispersa]